MRTHRRKEKSDDGVDGGFHTTSVAPQHVNSKAWRKTQLTGSSTQNVAPSPD